MIRCKCIECGQNHSPERADEFRDGITCSCGGRVLVYLEEARR